MFDRALRPFVLIAAVAFVFACGDDDDGSPTDPGTDAPVEASGSVDATGGTLTASDGSFTFTIPVGALAASTDIVVREIDPVELSRGTAKRSFEFEPADLDFAVDATFEADLPADLSRRGMRTGRAALPVVTVTPDEVADPSSLPDVLDYVARIDHAPSGTSTVAITIRGTGSPNRVISISEAGPPLPGEQPVDVSTLHTETFPDGITGADQGNTITIQTRSSVPSFFTLASQGNPTYIPGTGVDLSSTLAAGQDVPVLVSGVDNLGRNFQTVGIDVAVATGLQDGSTASISYGIHRRYDVDLAGVWDADEPVSFEATVEEHFPGIEFPVVIEGPMNGYATGVYDVGAGVEGGAFFDMLEGWSYQHGQVWGFSGGARIMGPDFQNLTQILQTPPLYGFFVASQAPDVGGEIPQGIIGVGFGANYYGQSLWDYENERFGFTQLDINAGNVTDALPYENDPLSGGFLFVDHTRSSVRLFEFDGEFWQNAGRIEQFPEATGNAFCAFVRPGDGAAIITNDGQGGPGQLYYNAMDPPSAPSTLIGTIGNDPRRMLFVGDRGFISLFGGDGLQLIDWPLGGVPSIGVIEPIGDGPVGIDAIELPNGNAGVLAAEFLGNSVSYVEYDMAFERVAMRSMMLPSTIMSPGHVRFVPGDGGLFAVSGNATGNVGIFELEDLN